MSEEHQAHCFVAVAYGQDAAEHESLQGWVDEVIRPVIVALGLDPKVAALESAPNAITLEIRTHLASWRSSILVTRPPTTRQIQTSCTSWAFDTRSICPR